jgi:hypothetical protein
VNVTRRAAIFAVGDVMAARPKLIPASEGIVSLLNLR